MAGVVDDQVLGHRARGAQSRWGDAEFGSAGAVVLPALGAGAALPAAPRSVDRVRAADLDALDTGAELVDDARTFVAEGERQSVDVLLGRQVHDEPVGVAEPRGGHLQTDLAGTGLRDVDLDDLGTLADLAVLDSLHVFLLHAHRDATAVTTLLQETGTPAGANVPSSLSPWREITRCARDHPRATRSDV